MNTEVIEKLFVDVLDGLQTGAIERVWRDWMKKCARDAKLAKSRGLSRELQRINAECNAIVERAFDRAFKASRARHPEAEKESPTMTKQQNRTTAEDMAAFTKGDPVAGLRLMRTAASDEDGAGALTSPLFGNLVKNSEPVSFARPAATFGETPGAGTITRDNVRDNFRASDYKPDELDLASMTPAERARVQGFDNFGLARAGFDKPVPGLTKPQPGLPADSPLRASLEGGTRGLPSYNNPESVRDTKIGDPSGGKSLIARTLFKTKRRDDNGQFREDHDAKSAASDASAAAQAASVQAEQLNSPGAHRRADAAHSTAAEMWSAAGDDDLAAHHRERAEQHRSAAEESGNRRER